MCIYHFIKMDTFSNIYSRICSHMHNYMPN